MQDETHTQGPPEPAGEPDGIGQPAANVDSQRATRLARARSALARRVRPSRSGLWAALALLCLLAGIAGGLLVAHRLADRQAAAERSDFQVGAAQVEASVRGAVGHEADLAVAAGTFFAGRAKASPAAFAAWAGAADIWGRYPELRRIGLIRPTAHAPGRCVTAVELRRSRSPELSAGGGYCARGGRVLATHSQAAAVGRAPSGHASIWEVQTPIYRAHGVRAGKRQHRRAAFAGWLREVFRPSAVLDAALAGHAGYSARLSSGSGSVTIGSGGPVPRPGAQSDTFRLPGGLTLRSYGPTAHAALLGAGRVWVLAAGALIGLLAAIVILLLGLRRRREPAPAEILEGPPAPAEPLYDPLSGLPNRALTLDRAAWLLARVGRQSGLLGGALLIDIDWMGDVNEKLGRSAGDQLLRIAGERLAEVVRAGDTVGRLDGDRFVVLVECAARSVPLDSLAQRVIEAMHRPLELEGFGPSFSMTASVGVSFGRYRTPEEMLGDAALALEQAKEAGKDSYAIFNANARSVVEGRGVLDAELNAAVQEQRLQMGFQPIFDLETGAVVGVEAQPCWMHPRRGAMGAEALVALADQSGLSVPIDRWAMHAACAGAAAWEVQGRRIGVSVKLSAGQLARDGLIVDIRRALQQSGLDPSLLTLQIAESAVMSNVAAAGERMGEIKGLGVGVTIDDFGAGGYAYHSDLRSLSLDGLRVDRGTLAAADDAEYRDWLFEAILMVGRDLSLRVIAKGIDSEQQLAAVRAMGCRAAQGAALGEPVAADAVIDLCDAGLAALRTVDAPSSPPPEPVDLAGRAGDSDPASDSGPSMPASGAEAARGSRAPVALPPAHLTA